MGQGCSCAANIDVQLESARPKTPDDKQEPRVSGQTGSAEPTTPSLPSVQRRFSSSMRAVSPGRYQQRRRGSLTVEDLTPPSSQITSTARHEKGNTNLMTRISEWQLAIEQPQEPAPKHDKRSRNLDDSHLQGQSSAHLTVGAVLGVSKTAMKLSPSKSSVYEPPTTPASVLERGSRWKEFEPHAIDYTNLYERIGEDRLKKLVQLFMPKLFQVFPDVFTDIVDNRGVMEHNHEMAVNKMTGSFSAWLIERLGGPSTDKQMSAMCSPGVMRSVHSSVKITDSDLNRWLACLNAAFNEAEVDREEAELLESFLRHVGTHSIVNSVASNHRKYRYSR